MPVDEFYKHGERYPTLSERRELKAAQVAAEGSTPPPPPPADMVRLV
jgi:hypothetical protein